MHTDPNAKTNTDHEIPLAEKLSITEEENVHSSDFMYAVVSLSIYLQ